MASKITKKYNVSAAGLLTIDEGKLYISVEDGPQDIDLAELLEDFADRSIKLSVSYDEDYDTEAE